MDALPRTGGGAEWKVQRVDGSVFSFRELTTLQRWIVERKVGRDDVISRAGKQEKRLGDIAELDAFFHVVDAQVLPQQNIPTVLTPQSALPRPTGSEPRTTGPAWERQPQQLGLRQPSGNWQILLNSAVLAA